MCCGENNPLHGWNERFTHPLIMKILFSTSSEADIFSSLKGDKITFYFNQEKTIFHNTSYVVGHAQ